MDPQSAHVNAVQRQQRVPARVGSGVASMHADECLLHANAAPQLRGCPGSPVVKVTADNERAVARNARPHASGQRPHLLLALAVQQIQMRAAHVQRLIESRRLDYRVQDAPPLQRMQRNINVVVAADRMAAEDRVAVVAAGVHRITAVRVMRPHRIGEVLKLRDRRPVREALPVVLVLAHNLLQQHEIGADVVQRAAHALERQSQITGGEALVNVVRDDL